MEVFSDFIRGAASTMTAMAGLVSAIVGLIGLFKKSAPPQDSETTEPPEIDDPRIKKIKGRIIPVAFFILGVLVFTVIVVAKAVLPPLPSVEISSIPSNQVNVRIDKQTGAGYFSIEGASSNLSSKSNLRVYVLVHPAEPPAPGWDVQEPAVIDKSGHWQAQVWYGGRELPPQPGNKIQIVAVVAPTLQFTGYKHVSAIQDIAPQAQSDIKTIRVASLDE